MKTLSVCLIVALVALSSANKCYIDFPSIYSHITTPLKNIPREQIPTNFNWANVDGVNYLTLTRQQHIPQYCGSCWSFATTSALSDRIKIARKAQFPDINIAPQLLLSCDTQQGNQGCNGGNQLLAYKFMHENNITEETCSIYQAKGWTNGLQCSDFVRCGNCMPGQGCFAQKTYPVYRVDQYGPVNGTLNMMNEIYQRGPIACSIDATPEFHNYTGGIFHDTTGGQELNHVISLVGFGTENGVDYWIGRNSWSSAWGEQGYFRIVRGINNLGIETKCAWATPQSTWLTGEKVSLPEDKPKKDSFLPNRRTCKIDTNDVGSVITSPLPHEYLKPEEVPTEWDWRNVNGRNYLSWSINQHIPVYCGSCWAQGTSSALADRINIMKNLTFPQIALAPQVVINCGAGGSCEGGSPGSVYQFAHSHGIPEQSCQNYLAKDPDDFACSAIQNCMDCDPNTCWAVKNYKNWKASQYGSVSGAERMKAEIYARGPIACGIMVTDKFEAYTGGIFEERTILPMSNHVLSIVGYGIENGVEYWIGRNSWGTYWGEKGYFRIRMHKENLGIEDGCHWAVPQM